MRGGPSGPGWRAGAVAAICMLRLLDPPAATAQTVIAKTRPPTAVAAKSAAPAEPQSARAPSPPAPPENAANTGAPVATAFELGGDRTRTRLAFALTSAVKFQVFTLSDPYRVIFDAENLGFRLPAQAGTEARGLIKAFRYGLIAPGKSRIVIDVTGPVRIAKAEVRRAQAGQPPVLTIELEATDAINFLAAPPPPARLVVSSVAAEAPAAAPGRAGKPVIVIDPGHGGLDPGAVNPGAVREKDVVLAVARQLQAVLAASGRYDVRMTRSSDVFVSLEQRVAASRASRANLFISIHADSIGSKEFAQAVRGATVYTLSEQASSHEAEQLADKENAADRLAGIDRGPDDEDDQVKTILFDLLSRETQNFAMEFRTAALGALRQVVKLAKDPARSAAFRVLRQAQSPSVLIELGYMTNAEDARLLQSPVWQKRVAVSLATAVDTFFATRVAHGR